MKRAFFTITTISLSVLSFAQLTWVPCTMPVNTLTEMSLGPNGELVTYQVANPIQIKISSDQGQTWQTMPGTGGPNGLLTFDQRLHVTAAGSILFWANTGIGFFLWRSADNGNTFTQLSAPNGVPNNRFLFGFVNGPNGDVYAFGEGVLRSTDDGISWQSIVGAGTNVNAFTVNSTSIFGANIGTINQGALDGTGFAPISTGTATLSTCYAMATAMNDRIVAVGSGDRVISSADNGITWQALNTGIGAMPSEFDQVAASPVSDNWVAGKQNSVRFTDSAGSNWVTAETGLTLAGNEPIQGILCDSTGQFYLYAYFHLYRSDITTGMGGNVYGVNGFLPYPNPTKGLIRLPQEMAGHSVRLINAEGRIIASPIVSATGLVDLGHLSDGHYFLQATGVERVTPILLQR